ncbi:Glyoxalase-like domain-containing protein [Paramicrobacterium humi]|uniref:Glyoxalase-like domain-containing protein n=1 Tax=Paramicrobacterium humi TaxID=640635 RepID=A0A1H4JZ12_9MICO|nr:VOC family protein [Microbacterium humi]SEB50862.1 Glyoxalase-like domain-containing protein [Microbacterium humi]
MIGKLHATVIDCPDPAALAPFYEELLGMARVETEDDWITIGYAEGIPAVAFQQVENYRAPEWPDQEVPQQFHLDVMVDDLDEAERQVLEHGATDTGKKYEHFRVFLDPAGHPFCIVH